MPALLHDSDEPTKRRRWRRAPSAATAALVGLVVGLWWVGCGARGGVEEPSEGAEEGRQASEAAAALFVDLAAQSGLDFTHVNGMSGELYIVEVMGAGVALFDYDGDGDLDVYLVQGGRLASGEPSGGDDPRGEPLRDRLFRNDSVLRPDGSLELRFVDVTEQAGLEARGYGMGVAVGDYTNNGCPDLYVTNFGPNQLWRNNCDGTFTEVTQHSGTDDPRWSVPALFFDYDGDGWLDLFVGNFLDFRFPLHKVCRTPSGVPDYCGPASYGATGDRLLRNRGDGTFEDVTLPAGLQAGLGKALGAIAGDFTGDGRFDLYVANDGMPNFLWTNQGDGTFREEAQLAGLAVNELGEAEASMGVALGDYDRCGLEHVLLSHLNGETNTLYRNLGGGLFEDATARSGLGVPSWPYTGFGADWIDVANDGWLDLLVVNGEVRILEEQLRAGEPLPLRQPNQLFRNRGDGTFEEISARAGPAFAFSEVSRGAAFGDLDNDGAVDVVVTNNHGPVRLLRNAAAAVNDWLGVRVLTSGGTRAALGARVSAHRSGAAPLVRTVRRDGSYVSASDPRVILGLGSEGPVERLEVRWPDGSTRAWIDPPANRYLTLTSPPEGR